MLLKISKVELTKSKKSLLITAGNDTYFADTASGLSNAVGKVIEANIEDTDYQGKTYMWIREWQESKKPAPGLATQPLVPNKAKVNGDRWYMPFVSNTIAHAIAAGCIKDFPALNQWAKAAHDAAVALDALDEPGNRG